MAAITGFKAYDYRGRIPSELNPDVAYRIGRAYAEFLKPKRVVVGRDIRLSSDELCGALTRGLNDSGVDVYDIGLCGTEGVYFATFNEGMDGGVMVTASHNPPDYNGMKFVRDQSRPISGDTGLKDIQRLAEADVYSRAAQPGRRHVLDVRGKYIEHLLSYLDRPKLKKLKVVVNAGNGGAGMVVDQLEPHLPFEFIKVNHAADGTSRTACRTRCWKRTASRPSQRSASMAPIAASPGTATTTAASCSTRAARSSRATTSSACSPRCSSSASRARASCTIRA